MPTELAPALSADFLQELEGARRRVASLEEANRAIQYFLDRLARLSAFSQGLEETTSIASVSDLLFEELQGIFSGAAFLIALLEEGGSGLRIARVQPPTSAGAAHRELEAQLASGVFAWTLRQRRPTMVPAAHLEGRLVLMPLVTTRRTVGMLLVAITLPEGAVEQQHLTLATVVARQAAVCIDNLCLTEDLQRQNEIIRRSAEAALAERTRQLEAVRAISQEITRELDLPVLLSLITRRATELVGAESGIVYLWDEAGEILIPKAWHGLEDWIQEVRLRRGEGIAGIIVEGRAGLTLNDYRSSPHAHPLFLERTRITAVIAEPLLYRDRFVGVITINHEGTGRIFTERDRETLTLLTTQAAIAIENARLHDATVRRAQHLATLTDLTRTLTTLVNPQTVAEEILTAVQVLIPGSAGRLYERTGETEELRLVASLGLRDPDGGIVRRLRPGEGLIGAAAAEQEPILSQDVTQDPRFINKAWAAAEGLVTCIVLPLVFGARVSGVLAIYTRAPHAFTTEEVSALRSFAGQAAIAIENARLYEASERTAREARSLYEVAHSLTTSLEPAEVLHLIAVKTTALLGTAHAQVVLWDEATQNLRLGAAYGTEADRVRDQEFRLGEGVNGVVAQTRTALVVNDYQAFPHRVKELTHLVAVVGVPLLYRDRLLGVLTTHATQPGAAFTPDHLALLTSFADQAATAIENARLYEDLRRQMAEQQRALARLVQSARMVSVGLLAGGVAHDINNPLCIISNHLQLLRLQARDLHPTLEATLEAIEASADRIAGKIRALLEYAGRRPGERKPTPVNETVRRILSLVETHPLYRHLRMKADLAPDLSLLSVDEAAWEQVILELLTNAREAMPDGGSVTVTSRLVPKGTGEPEIRGTGEASVPNLRVTDAPIPAERWWVQVLVEDDGPGIAPADLPRLFDPFFTTKGRGGGMGLGLRIARDILTEHGGNLRVESDGRRGTRAVIELPVSGNGSDGFPRHAAGEMETQTGGPPGDSTAGPLRPSGSEV